MSAAGMAGMAMMTPAVWTPGYAVQMFFMWWIMKDGDDAAQRARRR